MSKVVFLDLEETVISEWADPVLVNRSRVVEWLEEEAPSSVGIFSFAIHHDQDLLIFQQEIAPMLFRALGITTFSHVPTVEDVACCGEQSVSLAQIFTAGKAEGFLRYVLANFEEGEYVLLDDKVETATLFDKDGLVVRTVLVTHI